MRCAKKVNKLINRPVMSLFGTRVSGTGTCFDVLNFEERITKRKIKKTKSLYLVSQLAKG
jgi:hypothetical protein